MKDKIEGLKKNFQYLATMSPIQQEQKHYESGYNQAIDDVLKLIPELPTDEEIDVEALYAKKQQSECRAFRDGAKWMKGKSTLP